MNLFIQFCQRHPTGIVFIAILLCVLFAFFIEGLDRRSKPVIEPAPQPEKAPVREIPEAVREAFRLAEFILRDPGTRESEAKSMTMTYLNTPALPMWQLRYATYASPGNGGYRYTCWLFRTDDPKVHFDLPWSFPERLVEAFEAYRANVSARKEREREESNAEFVALARADLPPV